MDIRTKYILSVLGEMKKYLETNFSSYEDAPKHIADEIEIIAIHVKKSTEAIQIRHYLLNYIGAASSFWRTIAPYTSHNKLLTHLEKVVNADEFSLHSLHIAQVTQLHEHYLVKQKELIEPLQVEIYQLQKTCETLQKTVQALRKENARLHKENDFFVKEIESLHEKFLSEKENKIKASEAKNITTNPPNVTSEPHKKTPSPTI